MKPGIPTDVEIPNPKLQIPRKLQDPKSKRVGRLSFSWSCDFEVGISLGFGFWDLGF
jgi:hypothetical protein